MIGTLKYLVIAFTYKGREILKKSVAIFTILIPLLVSMVSMVGVGQVYTNPTELYVDPPSIVDLAMVPPATFSVNVTVKNVTDLYGFDFMLNYTTAVLTATEITLGPFFPPGSWIVATEINDTAGYVRYMVTAWPASPVGINGSGTLAIVDFTVDDYGATILDLCDTILDDSSDPPNRIIHTVIDGYFSNKILGDVNGDRTVNASDLFDLSKAYGSELGYPNWDIDCDFDRDNKVDASDLFDLSKNYGKSV